MPDLSIILCDDRVAREWEPFALTRPVGELLYGALTFREGAERVFGGRCVGHFGAPHLTTFEEGGAPGVESNPGSHRTGARLFWLSRAVPAWGERERIGHV